MLRFGPFQSAKSRLHDTLIGEIAVQAASDTVRRIRPGTTTMSTAELRGYVRARAMPVVRAQVIGLVADKSMSMTAADKLIAAAVERTIRLVTRELSMQPISTIPAPHLRLRIAA